MTWPNWWCQKEEKCMATNNILVYYYLWKTHLVICSIKVPEHRAFPFTYWSPHHKKRVFKFNDIETFICMHMYNSVVYFRRARHSLSTHKHKHYFCTQKAIFLILFPKDERLKISIRMTTSVIANHLSNQQSKTCLVFQWGVKLKLLVHLVASRSLYPCSPGS